MSEQLTEVTMSERTDTERLDWLTKYCDIGKILLDADLEGTPRIHWSVWNDENGEFFTNPRAAIDAAIDEYERRDASMIAIELTPPARELLVELDREESQN